MTLLPMNPNDPFNPDRGRTLFGFLSPTLAPAQDVSGGGPPMNQQTPFQWGAGGTRMTPDAIAGRRRLAQQQMAAGMDFSPVQHWSQGAARVAQALVGNLENRRLDKAEAANSAYEQQILASLTQGGDGAAIQALSSPYLSDGAKDGIKLQWQAAHKTPAQPHYFEANNGDQYAIGPDGQPQKLFADPTPKMNFIPDGRGGGQWLAVPTNTGGGGLVSTGMPAAGGPAIGTVEDGFRFKGGNPADQSSWEPVGGAPSQGGATFR
jgi:hypothetical protein